MLTEQVFQEEGELSEFVSGFDRLLAWLDDGAESDGERYLEMRRRLVAYFDRRSRPAAEELADETLSRVARTLEQSDGIAVKPPARFCFVMARFVLLEDLRRKRRHVDFDETKSALALRACPGEVAEDLALRDRCLECLGRCLEQLRPEQRSLIVDYYRDTGRRKIERRRELARQLGITLNALAIRACRIRNALLTCLKGRLDGE